MTRAPAPLLVKHRPSRTMMCPSEAVDRKQSEFQQKPLAMGHPGEPGAVGACGSPRRHLSPIQKQVNSQRRPLGGGVMAQK